MQLSIHPNKTSPHPINGIFLRGESPAHWLSALKRMHLSLQDCKMFAVPGTASNSISGCVVACDFDMRSLQIADNIFLQLVHKKLFLPVFSDVFPKVDPSEWEALLGHGQAFLHPVLGLCLLDSELDWNELLEWPAVAVADVVKPEPGVSYPTFISTVVLEPDPEIEALKNPFDVKNEEKLPFNLEKLLSGNDRELEKYLVFLEKNPELALSLGITLDAIGANRGARNGKFHFSTSGFNTDAGKNMRSAAYLIAAIISIPILIAILGSGESRFRGVGLLVPLIIMLSRLFSGSGISMKGGRGISVVNDEKFAKLRKKYEKLAQKFEAEGDYRKAAHIYRTVLKNPTLAVQVLERGKLYQEAAEIYLKVLKDKPNAARVYEEGRMYREAIALYNELDEIEKVGDLYVLLNQKQKAHSFYRKKAEDYISQKMYVKAALIYSEKMDDRISGQRYLLEGWQSHQDAEKCLNLYLRNLRDQSNYLDRLTDVYENDVPDVKAAAFLRVIKIEYSENAEARDAIRDMAFELVSKQAVSDPSIVSEITHFSEERKMLLKDVMRFKLGKRAGMR